MKIDRFAGNYSFLSNFHPCLVPYEGREYPSAEYAFQAAKSLEDRERAKIAALSTSGQAKRAGKLLELRADWEGVKLDVMRGVVNNKFTWNPELRQALLDTGDAELVEGNDWGDVFWGVCKGTGSNHLGLILMETREWMKTLDQWLRKRILTLEELVADRQEARKQNLELTGVEDLQYTCDECWMARACGLAFDSYNTNGDCLLEK
jgi:hypothetical protein